MDELEPILLKILNVNQVVYRISGENQSNTVCKKIFIQSSPLRQKIICRLIESLLHLHIEIINFELKIRRWIRQFTAART